MTTKHEIEIPDLPEGWRAVAYRIPIENVDYVFIPHKNEVRLCDWETKTYRVMIHFVNDDRGRVWHESYGMKIEINTKNGHAMLNGFFEIRDLEQIIAKMKELQES